MPFCQHLGYSRLGKARTIIRNFSDLIRSVVEAVESKLAQQVRQELIAATQALRPEERLEASLEHCQLMAELYEAGRHRRAEAHSKPP